MTTADTENPLHGLSPVSSPTIQSLLAAPLDEMEAFYETYGEQGVDLFDAAVERFNDDGHLSCVVAVAVALLHDFEARFLAHTKMTLVGHQLFGWSFKKSEISQQHLRYLTPYEVSKGQFDVGLLYDVLLNPDAKIRTATPYARQLRAIQEAYGRLIDALGEGSDRRHFVVKVDAGRDRFRKFFNAFTEARLKVLARVRRIDYPPCDEVLTAKEVMIYGGLEDSDKDLLNLFVDARARDEAVTIRGLHATTGLGFAEIRDRVAKLVKSGLLKRGNSNYSSIESALSVLTPESARAYVEERFETDDIDGEVAAQAALLLAVLASSGADAGEVQIKQADLVKPAFRGIYRATSGAVVAPPLRALERQGVLNINRDVRPFGYQIVAEGFDLDGYFEELPPAAWPLVRQVVSRDATAGVVLPEPSWLSEPEQGQLGLEEPEPETRSTPLRRGVEDFDEVNRGWAEVAMGVVGRRASRGVPTSKKSPKPEPEPKKSLSPVGVEREEKTSPNLRVARRVDASIAVLVEEVTREGAIALSVAPDGTRTVTYTYRPDE